MSYNGGGYYPQGGGQGYVRGGPRQHYGGGGGRGGWNGGGGGGGKKRGREYDDHDQGGGGGYRRRYNDRGDYGQQGGRRGDYNRPAWNRQAPIPFKSPLEEFQDELWQFGSNRDTSDLTNDLPALAAAIRHQWVRDPAAAKDAIRVALRDLPHKIAHYAAVVALLTFDTPDNKIEKRMAGGSTMRQETTDEQPELEPIGRLILRDLSRALQQYADERRWGSARLLLFFFAALTDLGSAGQLVSLSSVLSVLDEYRKALDESGLSAARGDDCVRAIVETLLRLGPVEGTDGFKDAVSSYLANRKIERELFDRSSYQAQWEDPIETLISAMTSDSPSASPVYKVADLINISSIVGDDAASLISTFDMAPFTIPPELEISSVTAMSRPEPSSGLLGNEGVGHDQVHLVLRLFQDSTVPSAYDPVGTTIRSLISDIISIYEINRKDGATILLDLARWLQPGLFKDKDLQALSSDVAPKGWSLESLIVEAILTSILALPHPPQSDAYYYALLGELCRISPQTVAPPLGKCIRKLYAGLGADAGQDLPVLDADGLRRFAEWFAVHLSNFSFQWGWKDWASDMELGEKHPKRVFVSHTIALEVRLSYFDRVKGTIPPDMIRTGVMPDAAPGPVHAYESDDHEHHTAAAQLEKSMRLKSTVEEIEEELAAFQKTLLSESRVSSETEAEDVARDMFASTLLFIGSRSFSHFLNVLERYLPVLRSLFARSIDSRKALLDIVARFWSQHPQFRSITVQKLVQYRLVEPKDVVNWLLELPSWTFNQHQGKVNELSVAWHDPNTFELLRSTLRTTMTRLEGARSRLNMLSNAREREKAAAQASEQAAVEGGDDAEMKKDGEDGDDDQSDSEIRSAERLVEEVKEDVARCAIDAITLFAAKVDDLSGVSSRNENDKDDDGAWDAWWIEGWFRELCRFLSSRSMDKCLVYEQVQEAIRDLAIDRDGLARAILSSAQHWVEFA